MNIEAVGAYILADLTGYLWCSWRHRKYHRWTGDYRRDCDKCKSWYVWPDKQRIAELEAQPRLVRQARTTATFSSLPPDLSHGDNIVIENNVFYGTPICIDCGVKLPERDVRCSECKEANEILEADTIE